MQQHKFHMTKHYRNTKV